MIKIFSDKIVSNIFINSDLHQKYLEVAEVLIRPAYVLYVIVWNVSTIKEKNL